LDQLATLSASRKEARQFVEEFKMKDGRRVTSSAPAA
jgi:hypothetical protein